MKNKVLIFNILILFVFFFSSQFAFSQENLPVFTRQDTLRGSITPWRAWWDLKHYKLEVKVLPYKKYIEGSNTITYQVLKSDSVMQIDLQPPMEITKIEQNNNSLSFRNDGNVWFVKLSDSQEYGKTNQIKVFFKGNPKTSKNPPWDDGLTWKRDNDKFPFIATSCQGGGASIWWPCKDHMYDEPDSMGILITVPENLFGVSNGRLRKTINNKTDSTRTFEWFVASSISNYAVCMNIANYTHFSDKYEGKNGLLDLDFYVLPRNLERAKAHFKQGNRMLEAFEHWFGPYPFYKDGFKLVEAPFLGMEHQSCVAYGNQYKSGYLGFDMSGTGFGYNFDYIIVHESAHEWFANSITYKDIADMWVHESFATYAEGLYVEYYINKEAGAKYIIGIRQNIANDKPIIGYYDVNNSGSGDMYPKGANMLHMIRQILNNDSLWRNILLDMNKVFYHKTVDTRQIEDFLIDKTKLNLQPIFDQYLRNTSIPVLEYKSNGTKLEYRWTNCIEPFDMPVKIFINNSPVWLKPAKNWNSLKLDKEKPEIKVDDNFYIFNKNSSVQ